MPRRIIPFLILFIAFCLRVWQLAYIPPGLTHDEAGHGHDAAHILKGVRLIYFTVGYGREPLFDYVNAGLMAGMGVNPFTLRFSAVIWGTIALAATYRVARTLFGWEVGTMALALMGASFWPLATSRQILRSGLLPAEMAIAVLLFLKSGTAKRVSSKWLLVIGLGLAIAASLYTYIPARVLWLIFPLTVLLQYATRRANSGSVYGSPLRLRGRQRCSAQGATVNQIGNCCCTSRPNLRSLVSLPIAFALASPLFIYLGQHPEAELRIGTLSGPLTALQNGDASIILNNAKEFALSLVLPGNGDSFLAYTIPGKPLFDPITFAFFLVGLTFLIRHSLRNAHCVLLLLWLLIGLAPSLITGPTALTTRIIGAQPVLYILPAVGLVIVGRWLLAIGRWPLAGSRFWVAICSLFIASLFITSTRDYFFVWGQSPDVRAAYQSTLIEMVKSARGPTVISTVYPSAPHDPYIGELLTTEETRWVDGRLATILRAEGNSRAPLQLFAPASTPLHPFIAGFYEQELKVRLRPNDLDPYFDYYQQFAFQVSASQPSRPIFNNAIELRGDRWLSDSYQPGDVAEVFIGLTVIDPSQLGILHPPTFKPELNLFTHILNPDGTIFLQQDRLDAPSWQWQTGDTVIQIHQFAIPADAAPGEYQVEMGLYDRITGVRLLTIEGADHVNISNLNIR